MTTKKTKKPRPRDFDLAIPFEQQARRLPAAQRPALLSYLRRQRLSHPARTFWLIDETGRRHCL
jgi:hypothetical protein